VGTVDRSTFATALAIIFIVTCCLGQQHSLPNSTAKKEMNQEDTAQCHKGIVLSLLSGPNHFHLKAILL